MHFRLLHFEPLSIITIPICSYWQYIFKFQTWLKIWNLLETLKFFVSVLLLVLKIANQCMRNLLVNYWITMTGCVMFFLPESISCIMVTSMDGHAHISEVKLKLEWFYQLTSVFFDTGGKGFQLLLYAHRIGPSVTCACVCIAPNVQSSPQKTEKSNTFSPMIYFGNSSNLTVVHNKYW